MIEIFIDNNLIDPDNYMSLSQRWIMFDNTFKLGAVMSREMTLVIPNEIFDISMNEVLIKINNQDYAHLHIDKYDINEGGSTVTLNLVDKMVDLNYGYSAEHLVPCTTKEILKDIVESIGLELGTKEFINDDIPVNFWDNRITAREYLSMIAELNGGFARIEQDGKLYLRQFSFSSNKIIDSEVCEKIIIGEKHIIKRIVFDNGLVKFQTSPNEDLETLYLNPQNVFITDQEIFDKINLLNFEYQNLKTGRTTIENDVMVGDVLRLNYKGKTYYTIAQYSLKFNQKWLGGYELNLETSKQLETKVKGNVEQFKNVAVNMNRLDASMKIVTEQSDGVVSQVGLIQSDINGIKLEQEKQIKLTDTVEGVNIVELENAKDELLLDGIIRINKDKTMYLFPSDDLYPSNDLYPNDSRYGEIYE